MFCHADVVCLCASCGTSQCCVLHDFQLVNAGRECKRRPYRRVILHLYYLYDIYVSTMCIYCDYCVYHYMSTELVSLYTLDIGL